MAFVTVDSSSATVTDGPLLAESVPTVDLRLLSQSELCSLSLCSTAAFNSCRDDDVIIPKIDRSIFNESAGSRKQTYSRLRLAPASAATSSANRTPHPLQNPSLNNGPANSESSQIVTLLKQLFGLGTQRNFTNWVPIRVDYSDSLSVPSRVPVPVPEMANVGSIGQKRKRGRPRKNENGGVVAEVKVDEVVKDNVVYQNVDDIYKDIMNKDGIPVDLAVLGGLVDPFGLEQRRRREGLGSRGVVRVSGEIEWAMVEYAEEEEDCGYR